MLKKYLQYTIILLPILLLMALGAYFAYDSWGKYQTNTLLKSQLRNIKLLKSLEHSVLNEIVCVTTMGKHKKLMDKICNPTQKTTNSVMEQILSQKEDTSLYKLEQVILNIRNSIKSNSTVSVEKLVNGDLDKKINVFMQKYTDKLLKNSYNMDIKEYLKLYSEISSISYATESEKALISYYLSLNKPIPASSLIYWDKTVKQSEIDDFGKENIKSIFNQKHFEENLQKIEDIRLDIMTNSSLGRYKSNISAWVSALTKKQKVLNSIETMLLDHVSNNVLKELKQNTITLVLALLALLISILGLLFLLSSWRENRLHKTMLDELVDKVANVSSDDKLHVTESVTSDKKAYNYIASKYESLHEKESIIASEYKTNKVFLNNLAYEINTPLSGISGYTKLLKETPLNIEQNDFISMLENNFENLDSILKKLSGEHSHLNHKLEVDNSIFNIVRNIESSVETFSIKADQKDIVVGLYIDPNVVHKVKGDSIKLSQIITSLIENALESSSAYDTIDIRMEKIHSDARQLRIKVSVKDEGIGYNAEELKQIRNAFDTMESIDNLSNIDMKNLSISNKIIKRMGGKLEIESIKGKETIFSFTLSFEKDETLSTEEVYPTFSGMKIGLALPNNDIHRQVDKYLEMYVNHLQCEFEIYDYNTLLNNSNDVQIPELLFVYHNYARIEGELEELVSLPTKIALITSGSLRARINVEQYNFSSVVYAPITIGKMVKIIAESKIERPALLETIKVPEEVKIFDNLSVLLVENNHVSQQIITDVLKKFNMKTSLASNEKEALELSKEKDFNIILMDVYTTITDVAEITSKILYYERVNQLRHVPIIGLVNDVKPEEKEKWIEEGMDDIIAKPINSDTLDQLLQKYCIDLAKEAEETEEDALIAKILAGESFLKE